MTNKHKGDFSFEALGKQWTGRFSLNVLSELEEEFDMGVDPLFRMMATAPRINHMKSVFFAGLKKNHPELTRDLVGDLLQDVIDREGNFDALAVMFGQAARAAFPAAKNGGGADDGGEHPTPPLAAVGTGPAS